MPPNKQSALAAIDKGFADAVQSAFGTLYGSMAGKATNLDNELAEARTALRLAKEAHEHMTALLNELE